MRLFSIQDLFEKKINIVALKQKRIKWKEKLGEEIVFMVHMIKGVQNKTTKYLL